ncbi:hypothetical protein DdX_19542 [Ditylenchus destructor]|uniref:Uncharacterized protein n=1 Tax=Ditylenchus destructor TaxID=166010 RepID=A0AAD4MMF6_9BILA|nr:hypothetical protein DdX_19542 [Ditylenchus destructor]
MNFGCALNIAVFYIYIFFYISIIAFSTSESISATSESRTSSQANRLLQTKASEVGMPEVVSIRAKRKIGKNGFRGDKAGSGYQGFNRLGHGSGSTDSEEDPPESNNKQRSNATTEKPGGNGNETIEDRLISPIKQMGAWLAGSQSLDPERVYHTWQWSFAA